MSKSDITICSALELDIRKTFECGQCFRWNRCEPDGGYIGVAKGRIIDLNTRNGYVYQKNSAAHLCENERALNKFYKQTRKQMPNKNCEQTCHKHDLQALKDYLSLNEDYSEIQREIAEFAKKSNDKFLLQAADYCTGLRILKQDAFEALISFMISANNNIPKIKLSIEDMCLRFGSPLGEYKGRAYYDFPNPEALVRGAADIPNIRAIGYRARGIKEATAKILSGELRLNELTPEHSSFKNAVRELRKLYGVGEKVANCVALFGLGHMDAFPVDVWIKKALSAKYNIERDFEKFAEEHFAVHPGIAQQYLFFYLREISSQKISPNK